MVKVFGRQGSIPMLTRPAKAAKDGGDLPNLGNRLEKSSWLTCFTSTYSMASLSLSVRSSLSINRSNLGAVPLLFCPAALRSCWWVCSRSLPKERKGSAQDKRSV